MAWITLRQFAWTERPGRADAYPVIDDIHRVAVDRWLPVDLSYAVGVNALAVPAKGPVRYETRQHELRLLLCYLSNDPDGPVRLRDDTFRASAAHIRRFVSESIGLGMLPTSVHAAYQATPGTPAHFEAWPTMLATQHSATKIKPDLLLQLPGMVLAGEARGRSEPAPIRASVQQRDRLNSVLPWSQHHGTHPLAMTWASITGDGTTVDLFTRSGRLPGMTGPVGQPLPSPVPIQPDLFEQDHLVAADRSAEISTPSRETKARDFDPRSPRDLITAITRRTGDIGTQLYETAPEPDRPVRIADQAVRGRWAALDLFGPAAGSFLLGVLERPLSPEQSHEITTRLRQRTRSALVSGRLVVAITDDAADRPWPLVAD
ncbi:hypothetical protein JOF56_006282 [Kibdelosporangium banguiense]|uniref:DUF4132 domain-containing protein n=1 Tax=Kibdelosporangium banguiense TaxID=1365924 RepID=A0ABS4TNB8_9PSEU|nr:hypothetical protein [Kibdelosporangium banguiense]MBP2325897.1 hypothetical protein [Kibdelosporangium banguiense]